ncbi:hypothetical protein [uncultured Pseudomonas sp.]|uniref:hypothetical protein n=1 Tax=uncultured Pseudomonas sp. TaxID=114707 RepID=UPI00260109C8|nr:hypothetical protein [uncultured Pseudomonas sp.]
MSRYLRFFLVLLLSLALPLTGMAGVPSSTEPCPMQMSGMQMMSDMSPDCCADHGKSCKPGQECKTGGMLQLSMPVLKSPVAVSHPVVAGLGSDFIPDRTPSGVWRPPRT